MTTAPSSGNRVAGIEGLRGIAAVSVLVSHVHLHLSPDVGLGQLTKPVSYLGQGLTLFFALSGFLLFLPFVKATMRGSKRPDTRKYLRNRFLRIAPAYVFILLFVGLVMQTAYVSSTGPAGSFVDGTLGALTDVKLLIANVFLVHTLMPWSLRTGLGVSWSLTVEVVFYLVLPVVGMAAFALRKRIGWIAATLVPTMALLGVGAVGRIASSQLSAADTAEQRFINNWGDSWTAVLARSFVANADLFAFGMLAAVLVVALNDSAGQASSARRKWRFALGLLALCAPLMDKVLPDADVAFGIASASAIAFIALRTSTGSAGRVAKLLDSLPLRALGAISYSMYLWHVPTMWWMKDHGLTFDGDRASSFVANTLVVFAVVSVLSSITYLLVERPALRRKTRTAAKGDAAIDLRETSTAARL